MQHHDANVITHPLSDEQLRLHEHDWIARSIDGAIILAIGTSVDDIRNRLQQKGLTLDDVVIDTVHNEKRLLRSAAFLRANLQ